MDSLQAQVQVVAEELLRRRHAVALTGAGLSVDSGIPDFRSPGGLWERFDPMEFATIEAFRADPHRVWKMLAEFEVLLGAAEPNPGHLALAGLERAGVLDGIVTQNVDNLHQRAGCEHVIEFHGNGSKLRCLGCDRVEGGARRRELGMPPTCDCGQVLKPDVVFFGEMIPGQALRSSMELVAGCQVMLVVGTSATIAPASMIPVAAKQQGALLVEVNLAPTPITPLSDVAIHAGASRSLPMLADRVHQLLEGILS